MANQILNSTYGVSYNLDVHGNATIGPYSGSLEFNEICVNTFYNCRSLRTSLQAIANNISMKSIVNANQMFFICPNLTGSPVCGDNVTDASYMYSSCPNLTGPPVCGRNVIYATSMYRYCNNLTGSPVCGNNVIYANGMYEGCTNLTGSPVCGSNVTNANGMYYNCYNLTGSPVCGSNVTNASYMYQNCYNLTGSGNVYMNNVNFCYRMLYGRPQGASRINLFINPSKLNLKNAFGAGNIMGIALTWTDMTNGYYNASYNIYAYTNAT